MTAAILAVTGTGTGVGKTAVTAGIAVTLRRRGVAVDALKPVATGVTPGHAGEDAELLGRALESDARDCELATFTLPRSPLAAARAEGRTVDVDSLVAAVRARAARAGTELLLVEGVGGVLVPLTPRCTVAQLFRRIDAPVLIVAAAGLGTVNHTAMTVAACRDHGLEVAGVVLSDVDGVDPDFAAENAAQIRELCEVAVLGIVQHVAAADDVAALGDACARAIDLDALRRRCARDAEHRAHVVAQDRAHAWHPFTQTSEWLEEQPLVIRSGEGCWLIDEDGTRYLDGIASLWANVHGHAHPVLDRALREQAGRIAHSTFLGQTHEQGALLAAELAAVAPRGLTRVFFSEAGAAAVEVALRIALRAQQLRGDPARTRFLSLIDAYHGDTAGSVSVGRSEPFHRGLEPLLFDVLRVPPPHLAGEEASLRAMEAALAAHGSSIAAVLIEPRVQGAAGMWMHSDAWLRAVARLVRDSGALLICDEVATGFGRTGDLFASQGAQVQPDIMVLGKGLTGGYLPLSATLVREELFELFTGTYAEHRTLYYGHTFSANPIACAVARASLRLFATDGIIERARAVSSHLADRLDELRAVPGVLAVRSRGVMAGIDLGAADRTPLDPALRTGRRVALAARSRGVIVRPLGDTLVLNPPLVISRAETDLLMDAVGAAVRDVVAMR